MVERIGRFLLNWWPAAMPMVVICLIFYAWLLGWVVVHGSSLIFHPRLDRIDPDRVGLNEFKSVEIGTEDGETLVAWWHVPQPGAGVVLFLHGDASTLADSVPRLGDLAGAGLGVLGIEWRGYGGSTGKPSERGLRLDAKAGFDFIKTAAPASRIAVFAESLGTGIAVELACDRPVAGLVLNSPYASVRRFFELRGPPLLPYRLLVQDRIDAEATVAGVNAPILILQGTADTLVPIAESRRLFAAAVEPKTMIEVEGAGHLQAWTGDARRRGLDLLTAWTR